MWQADENLETYFRTLKNHMKQWPLNSSCKLSQMLKKEESDDIADVDADSDCGDIFGANDVPEEEVNIDNDIFVCNDKLSVLKEGKMRQFPCSSTIFGTSVVLSWCMTTLV